MFGFRCSKGETDGPAGVQPSTGVGANAFQDPQMVFFANSPLSELVWSQEGLGIKYTNSDGLGEKKTPIFWSTETFNIILNTPFNGVCLLSKEEREMENFRSFSDLGPRNLMTRLQRDSKSCGEINMMNEPNQELDQKIISNINYENKATAEINRKSHINGGPSSDVVSASVFQPCASNHEKLTKIAKSSSSNSKKEKITEKNRKFLDKGKEKVIYERENENMVKESDNSNESVESTGSIMSKRKRPFKFCNSTNLESKRFKKEINNKSSFMNWISSISSGFKASNEAPMIKPLNVEKWSSSSSQKSNEGNNVKTVMPFVPNGFGSFFHTLYRQNNTLSSCSNKKESFSLDKSIPNEANYNNNINFNLGLNSADRSQDEINTENPNSLNVEIRNKIEKREESGWACVVRNTGSSNSSNNENKSKSNVNSSNNDDKSRSNEEKGNINANCGYLENIWISRLLPKDASSSKLRIENSEFNEGQSERKFKSNLSPITPSNKRKETDCMASLFARRLGAIKHAEPPNLCSFQNLEKIEEENLCSFQNLEKHEEELEVSKCKSPCNNDKKMVLWCEKKGKNVANESSRERNLEWKEIGSSCNENVDKKGKGIIRNSDDNLLNCNNLIDETSTIFESVRRLRFSRMDIIRWMKSSIKSATLDGFYLRLRLSKLKQEIGKTGYHVGRINGTSGDKFLSVRVGRFTCLVEPHCISNQDFLEDELTAWWSAAERGDFNMPLNEELDRKLKEKHLLGF
ncbi:hypothetical protein LUZ60_001490 [Juncus effusus]|nr:hypothetical protein LUZ60_001490 [Juncus effusus]